MLSKTPVITDMKVIPCAGYDSMLLSLSGAHGPLFTRNIVIITDNSGSTGIGEVHGGDDITKILESYIPLVVGKTIGEYKSIISSIRNNGYVPGGNDGQGLQKLDLSNLKFVVHAETAVECALLDLLGKFLGLPVCELLGDGQQRDEVVILGYLFYCQEYTKTDMAYLDESGSHDRWFSLRRRPAMTTDRIVENAHAMKERYGFKDFKLKGGVLNGWEEMETVRELKKDFPDARINIDPNGAWTLEQAIEYCRGMKDILTYIEDPCGDERGVSVREIMREFKNATGIQVATNMIATDWRQFYHAASQTAVDIVLADPHFWTMSGSVRMGQVLNDWGLTWGSHSNNHFDISLAIFAHSAAAAPGNITALDTHYVYQDGQYLTKNPMEIRNGVIEIRREPGLGIEVDTDAVMKANELYRTLPYGDRNDAMAMQYLIPGWKFDHKKPCMVR